LRRLIAIIAVFGLLALPSAALATPTLLGGTYLRFQVEPGHILVSGDGTGWLGGAGYQQTGHQLPEDFGRINWISFGGKVAIGEGLFWINNCRPYCAGGSFSAYPTMIHASDIRHNHYQHMATQFRYGGKLRHYHYELVSRGTFKIWQPLYEHGF
jgi:hypothetical protein